jgi:hypothetical protein
MKEQKDLPVKAYVSASEYLEFSEACVIADVKHSRILRALLNDWTKQVKSTSAADQKKSTNVGLKWSLPAAHSRVNYGVAPVRLRV